MTVWIDEESDISLNETDFFAVFRARSPAPVEMQCSRWQEENRVDTTFLACKAAGLHVLSGLSLVKLVPAESRQTASNDLRMQPPSTRLGAC
jgi:hypothetical protein